MPLRSGPLLAMLALGGLAAPFLGHAVAGIGLLAAAAALLLHHRRRRDRAHERRFWSRLRAEVTAHAVAETSRSADVR